MQDILKQAIRTAGTTKGIALLTVMLVMVIMSVIGIAALTVTGLENRLAGFGRTGEAAATAAESCVGTSVNLIQQTIDLAVVPVSFLATAAPAGPVPAGGDTRLTQEIMGQSDNNADDASATGGAGGGGPNLFTQIGTFAVFGDIDRLYAKARAGGALEFASGFDTGPGGGGVDIIYRIDCVALNTTTNTTSRITSVYACAATGESCQKKL
jgi:type IV pilus assembly PilX-like protein